MPALPQSGAGHHGRGRDQDLCESGPPESTQRYERAHEFVDVVKGRWDSFGDDAFQRDKASGVYFDPDKLYTFNHVGKYFKVKGPLNLERPPQGHPVIVQAGSSEDGKELAVASAEAIFTAWTSLAEAQAFYRDVKGRLAKYARRPELPPGINSRAHVVIELARREGFTVRELYQYLAGARGHWVVVGTPQTIPDRMQEWFENGAADGFNIMPPVLPQSLNEFVDLVVPELQKRGLFRTAYEGRTLRENLGLARPESRYAAQAQAA